jgi:phosphatidylglycerol:prolipoprotein diacylglycerol transferase
MVSLSEAYSLPVHPAQLYAFLLDVVLFFILSIFFKYRKRNGETLFLFGILYPVVRFCLELLRGDNPLYLNLFTVAQIISIAMFVVSLPLFVISRYSRAGKR